MKATNNANTVIRAGTLGSEVLLNLVPPMNIGILVLVSGILRVESPRLGINIAKIIPVGMFILKIIWVKYLNINNLNAYNMILN